MEQKTSVQIGKKAFIQSLTILAALMIASGVLTRVVPAGRYARMVVDGRELIDPGSYVVVARSNYPIWRWATAPVEVLWGPDGLTIAVIIVFLLMVGASFAVLDGSGILNLLLARLVDAFCDKKYVLLPVVALFFMLVGAFLGIFEEVVPLVPLMVALAYSLGWDALVGLGMSALAANMGFSAAVMNPFSIGVAHKIAGLPLFSGAGLRILFFVVVYAIFCTFLIRYARKVEHDPSCSMVAGRARPGVDPQSSSPSVGGGEALAGQKNTFPGLNRAMIWFIACIALILVILFSGPIVPVLADYALPLVGLVFLIGGVGAGLLAGMRGKALWQALGAGVSGIAPGVPLILMAASVKHIVAQGGIMDTLLHGASLLFASTGPLAAALVVYLLALLIELFIGSASAKAFLIMPILLPVADLVGVTRQIAVTAYCFGDGFSNMIYPTNPVLLIALGLAAVSYGRWVRWTAKLWLWIVIASVAFLWLASAINYGPF